MQLVPVVGATTLKKLSLAPTPTMVRGIVWFVRVTFFVGLAVDPTVALKVSAAGATETGLPPVPFSVTLCENDSVCPSLVVTLSLIVSVPAGVTAPVVVGAKRTPIVQAVAAGTLLPQGVPDVGGTT